jgi:4-hydroxyphenylpyruvate dioxygenase
MKPCLSQTLTMPLTFAEDIAHYADAGCDAIEVWLTKLENHLEHHSLDQTRALLQERNITLAAAAYQGGLLLSQGDARKAHYELFRKRLNLCQALGIRTLLVVADFVDKVDGSAMEQAVTSLQEAGRWAAAFDVTLALEFRGKNTFCASLDTALALVHACGEPNVGVNFDLFHYYTGPSKFEDLGLLSLDRLAHVQVADLAGIAREIATDSDRVLPGDGDFQIQPILDFLQQMGYQGWISLEMMNPTLWRANPKQVVEIAWTSLRKILGQAEAPSAWKVQSQ